MKADSACHGLWRSQLFNWVFRNKDSKTHRTPPLTLVTSNFLLLVAMHLLLACTPLERDLSNPPGPPHFARSTFLRSPPTFSEKKHTVLGAQVGQTQFGCHGAALASNGPQLVPEALRV